MIPSYSMIICYANKPLLITKYLLLQHLEDVVLEKREMRNTGRRKGKQISYNFWDNKQTHKLTTVMHVWFKL